MWFGAEVPTQKFLMVSGSSSEQKGVAIYPLEALSLISARSFFTNVLKLSIFESLKWYVALCSGLYTVLMYILLRLNKTDVLNSVLFTILATVSASAIFCFPLPGMYTFSGIILLLCLILFSLRDYFNTQTIFFLPSKFSCDMFLNTKFGI